MVSIENKTEEGMVKKKRILKRLDLIKEYFGNLGHVGISESGIALSDDKGDILILNPAYYEGKVEVYTSEISREKLEEFGKEYEKRLGIRNVIIELDYSEYKR